MIEEFKDIKNYEDVYQITSYGRIYNKILKKFRKLHISKDGYSYIDLWDKGSFCTFRVHRLVAEAFCYGQTEEKNLVNHKDLNKLNNYYKNLEWCTQQENVDHAKENGVWKINQFSPSAILTNEEAKEIIELLMDTNIKMKDIANHYGVVRGAIFNIYSKLTWKNFTENIDFPKRYNNIKLNEEIVFDICNLLNEKKLTDTQIGELFGVNRKTINDIKLKKTWKKVSNEIINF